MPASLEGAAGNHIHLIPYDQDPFHLLTQQVIERAHGLDAHASSQTVVIIPDLLAAPRLQQCLIEQARHMHCEVPAGIHINTLRGWIAQNILIDQAVISAHAGRLMLVESLMQFPGLLGSDNPWRLADNLIELFDQLTLRQLDLPDDLEQFSRALGKAYGLGKHTPAGLGQEAKIVHTLWHGWHKQLREEGVIDAQSAYLLKLKKSLENPRPGRQFYAAGFHELPPVELAWCRMLGERNQLTFITQGCIGVDIVAGDLHPDAPIAALLTEEFTKYETIACVNNLTSFINCIYTLRGLPLAQRAREFAREIPASPAAERLCIFEAQGAEQEACAIEFQVRRWLAEGKQTIGILTEDRRLARRVRALPAFRRVLRPPMGCARALPTRACPAGTLGYRVTGCLRLGLVHHQRRNRAGTLAANHRGGFLPPPLVRSSQIPVYFSAARTQPVFSQCVPFRADPGTGKYRQRLGALPALP